MARRIFEAVVGIVLLAVAFILAFVFQQAYRTGVEYQSLPVPVLEILPYTVLSDKMFEMKDFPRALSGGYATTLDQLSGHMSNSRIPAGLPIPLVLVNPPKDYRLADPSQEVVSIPITPPSAVGGQVRPGEKVNIYRLIPPGAQIFPVGSTTALSEPVSLIAENIPVVLVLGDDGSPAGLTSTGHLVAAHVLVLAVTKDQLDAILNLLAETKQSAIMWVTLAPVQS
jgi:Flp pilus assembly protein CpaB